MSNTRLTDQRVSHMINIMQRQAVNDLSGHVQKTGEYEHICIPAKLTPDINPPELAKYYKDGLMDPVRLPESVLVKMQKTLGSRDYAGQYLQRPVPEGGNLISTSWFGNFRLKTLEDQAYDDHKELAWNLYIDGAYTTKQINDPTAILCSATYKGNLYIRDVVRVWMELPELINLIPDVAKRNGLTSKSRIIIEPKIGRASCRERV